MARRKRRAAPPKRVAAGAGTSTGAASVQARARALASGMAKAGGTVSISGELGATLKPGTETKIGGVPIRVEEPAQITLKPGAEISIGGAPIKAEKPGQARPTLYAWDEIRCHKRVVRWFSENGNDLSNEESKLNL
jgi:hypothetical protein